MTRALRSRFQFCFLFLLAGFVVWGCNIVVGSGKLTFDLDEDGSTNVGDSGSDGGDGGCEDPTGNGGNGCYSCTPSSLDDYLNSCTTNDCTPFDDSAHGVVAPGSRPLPSPPDAPDAAAAADAGGIPSCNTLPNPVFLTGASYSPVFIGKIAQSLANQGVSLVFYNAVSCTAFSNVLNGHAIGGIAFHWSGDVTLDPSITQNQIPCVIDDGTQPDIAVSDVFGTTCETFASGSLPSTVEDTFGPVQAMGFAVPTHSAQKSISANAAYNIFGFGAQSGVTPWIDESAMFQRGASSGTQNLVAATIGLPAADWRGVYENSTADMTTALINQGSGDQATNDKTIGIVSSDVVIARSDQLRLLAFQGADQTCGFWPDSTATAKDRRNVRDGRYALWGPYHFFTQNPVTNANVKTVLDATTGTVPVTGVDLLSLYAQKGLTPLCAMHVTRSKDGGGVSAYKPDISCSCYFDFITSGASSCTSCTVSANCGGDTPNCNTFNGVGYCEP